MRWLVLMLAFATLLAAQVPGAPGRTTGAHNLGSNSVVFPPAIGPLNCSGTVCTATSGTTSPDSHVVSGTISFTASKDAFLSFSGLEGGGGGQFQFSCDGGSSWGEIAVGSDSSGQPVTYVYPPAQCTGPTNLNTIQFRSVLGGGGALPVTMLFDSPTSVVISW